MTMMMARDNQPTIGSTPWVLDLPATRLLFGAEASQPSASDRAAAAYVARARAALARSVLHATLRTLAESGTSTLAVILAPPSFRDDFASVLPGSVHEWGVSGGVPSGGGSDGSGAGAVFTGAAGPPVHAAVLQLLARIHFKYVTRTIRVCAHL